MKLKANHFNNFFLNSKHYFKSLNYQTNVYMTLIKHFQYDDYVKKLFSLPIFALFFLMIRIFEAELQIDNS